MLFGKKSKETIGFLAVFLLTLQSFYFYQINLAPFPLLGMLLLFYYGQEKVSLKLLVIVFSFVLLFIFSGIFGIIFKLDFYYINSLIGVIIGPFVLLLTTFFIKEIGSSTFSNILKQVLWIHFTFFAIQIFCFYVLNKEIDYLILITGEESRNFATGAITGLVRGSGLYNEPATYSYFIFLLLFGRLLANKSLNITDQVIMFSMALTISISGILLYFFFQIYYWLIYKKNIKSIIVFIIISIIIIILGLYVYEDTIAKYFLGRVTNISGDESSNIRFTEGILFFLSLPFHYLMFGVGIGNYSNSLPAAASGITYLVTTFGLVNGLIFLIILISYLIYIKLSKKLLIPLLAILFSTIIPNMIIFWFVLGMLSVYQSNNIYD